MPRVRVVYNTVKDKFFVYHADNLKGDGFVDILRSFALPIDKTVFEIDLDYCNYDKELESKNNEDCKKKLESKYSLTDIQADVILDCKIKWLCEFDRNKLDKEIEDWSNILI